MTAVALLLSGAPTGAFAQTDMHVADLDANARFLCTYGQFLVSYYSLKQQSGYRDFGWEHVAVPFVGQGQTVSQIMVMEGQVGRGRPGFSAGIYSSNKKGFPGTLIAGGTGSAPGTCGPVTINIPPTTLMANTKYWLEEKLEKPHSHRAAFSSLYWYADAGAKRGRAYVQNGRGECSGTCSQSRSPWQGKAKGPWFRLK